MSEMNMDQALQLYLNKVLADTPSQHPERTPDCVSLMALNRHVKGKRRLANERKDHINECPFCQRMLSSTREHCGYSIRAVAAETLERMKEFFTPVQCLPPIQFADASGPKSPQSPRPIYPLIIEDDEGNIIDGDPRVVIVQGPWVEGGYLIMRITLRIPERFRADQKRQLLLISADDEQPAVVLELAGLERQMLKIKLPEHLQAEAARQVKASASLPYGFVLRVGATRLLAKANAPIAATDEEPAWTVCPISSANF